jgi:hypothetical protein
VTFVCAVRAAVVVVVYSNERVADWRTSPSVLLGVLSGVVQALCLYALWKGVMISWWRSALRGTTLKNLNHL